MTISVSNHQKTVPLDLRWLKKLARRALNECINERAGGVLAQLPAVDVAIVSDDTIAAVHRQFMKIDGATDVITFDHGEIVISAETARANAVRYARPIDTEVALYIVHGLLHLTGFTDTSAREAARMRRVQNRILKKFLSVPV
jgi:rRNA maturation RNase YbeY